MARDPGLCGRPGFVTVPCPVRRDPNPVFAPNLVFDCSESRFCRAGPGRPSVTDPSSVTDVVNLYIRFSCPCLTNKPVTDIVK